MSTDDIAIHIIIIEIASVDFVFITFAYRIVAVAAEAKGKTYAQYSPITEGIWNKVGPIPNKRINRMSTQPSNISAKNIISIRISDTTPIAGAATRRNILGDPFNPLFS